MGNTFWNVLIVIQMFMSQKRWSYMSKFTCVFLMGMKNLRLQSLGLQVTYTCHSSALFQYQGGTKRTLVCVCLENRKDWGWAVTMSLQLRKFFGFTLNTWCSWWLFHKIGTCQTAFEEYIGNLSSNTGQLSICKNVI